MSWFRVDDQWHSHPKVLELSLAARGLWVTAGSWCGSQLTDGTVPRGALRVWGATPKLAAELVAAGLWDVTENGWQFHDWLALNPSRESVLSQRDNERTRKAEYREKRKLSQRDKPDPDPSRGRSPDPTRPDPTPCVEGARTVPPPDPDAAALVRLRYGARYADLLAASPSPKSLARDVPPVAEWVRANAPLRKLSEAELVDRLLDGLFARADLEAKRWPLSFVAQDPLEFLDPPAEAPNAYAHLPRFQ